jgi:hypothetical protein
MTEFIDFIISWLDRFQSRWAVRIENIQGALYHWKHELERLEELLGRRPPRIMSEWERRGAVVVGKGNGEVDIIRPVIRFRRYNKIGAYFGSLARRSSEIPPRSGSGGIGVLHVGNY